jgi:hypothetical protein
VAARDVRGVCRAIRAKHRTHCLNADARGVFTAARRTPFTTLRFGRNTASFEMARGPRKRLVAGGRVSLPFAAAAH